MPDLFYKGTGEPFHCIDERRRDLRPLPKPLTVLKVAIACLILAGVMLYLIGCSGANRPVRGVVHAPRPVVVRRP